tara:strand:+ start:101 stop:958 length:858 start_codon:yes stop_codon:yes gene_type:complete
MKILWISDFCLDHTKGGAQRSDNIIIDHGLSSKLDITWFNHDSDLNILDEKYDHVISTNLETISKKYPHIINWLQQHPNHSRLEHDMNAYLNPSDRQLLFANCKNTFFLTHYHYELFKNSYGDFFRNVRIIQDPIDTKTFRDHQEEREDKILYAGFMHLLKGTETFFNYVLNNPEKQFVVAGWGGAIYEFLAEHVPNVEYLGTVDYEEMPQIYNKYKTLFYHPMVTEPFCRSVAEAMLCGIQLNVNARNLGCISEAERIGLDKFKDNCDNAARDFWDIILKGNDE